MTELTIRRWDMNGDYPIDDISMAALRKGLDEIRAAGASMPGVVLRVDCSVRLVQQTEESAS